MGGINPIRIQSMTNTDTNDIGSTINQCIQLADAGCELVRITAQGEREANSLALIRKELRGRGYDIPVIADIHFNPRVAEIAAAIVDKVRINPGNYMDNRVQERDYSEKEYELELERTADKIYPLLKICSAHGTAIRIGSNHGSLGSRIISRYGDTPEGMVESALEFARICSSVGFHNLVLSMKSSNVRVMVQATRLLVHRMLAEKMDFPVHLGVTEAGDGEDGIIKSAVGIGALLEDGIGDTIRVSLTGDPLKEIPVAKAIVARYNDAQNALITGAIPDIPSFGPLYLPDPFSYSRTETLSQGSIGQHQPVQVVTPAGRLLNEDLKTTGEVDWDEASIVKLSGNGRRMRLSAELEAGRKEKLPVLLNCAYSTSDLLELQVNAAIDAGTLLIDGIGDALCIEAPSLTPEIAGQTAFSILQATRTRITRTEYISCPSCGRTLFDIEATLEKVKTATSHLKGLKIAVMGCIVNGPGEMADADFGYVGAGKGKVSLYKGKELVKRGIPEESAIEELILLIKESGAWQRP
jgi:(E)-4-hydroxy-3-methylbut-2-enyl-diphosphate synthase